DYIDVLATTTQKVREWDPWHREVTSPAVWTRQWAKAASSWPPPATGSRCSRTRTCAPSSSAAWSGPRAAPSCPTATTAPAPRPPAVAERRARDEGRHRRLRRDRGAVPGDLRCAAGRGAGGGRGPRPFPRPGDRR